MAREARQICARPSIALARYFFAGLMCLGAASCAPTPAPPHEQPHWPTLPLANVPVFMQDTLFQRVRFGNTEPIGTYGYSLVVNLHDTGNTEAPTAVRAYIARQIVIRGFGWMQNEAYKDVTPQQMLADKRVAIVEVAGMIPVGARANQRIDIDVRAMTGGHTKSLAHGRVYQTNLSDHGLVDPEGIDSRVMVISPGGQIFVNPAYALSEGASTNPSAQSSLLHGVVLNGGVVQNDRPIYLELRQPQLSIARRIEQRIQQRWQDDSAGMRQSGMWTGPGVAEAQDEGLVEIYVPATYKGDWKHFLGVVSHLYLNDSSAFSVGKAKQLVTLAHQPNPPLADISLCWEAMGQDALPVYEPLISDPNPDVAFAAARAAAFCGDVPARQALLTIASDANQHNQIDAVRAIGELPSTTDISRMLRILLNSPKADVRIAAYRNLVDSSDSGIETIQVADRFYLDLVESTGTPMVYATTTGVPRIAVFCHNHKMALRTPITFMAMNSRFSISSSDGTKLLTLFYRDPQLLRPNNALSDNDLAQIVSRLGGYGQADGESMDLSFGDIVAIVQQLVGEDEVVGTAPNGDTIASLFELEHPQLDSDAWTSIPRDSLSGRPQGSGSPRPATMPAKTAVSARSAN